MTPSATLTATDETHDGESVAIPLGGGQFSAADSDSNVNLYELHRRLAATAVHRAADQHGCQANCAHPDHRRDLDYARHLLESLDLPTNGLPVTDAERELYRAGSGSLPDIALASLRHPGQNYV